MTDVRRDDDSHRMTVSNVQMVFGAGAPGCQAERMSYDAFYSDRQGRAVPRVSEVVSANVWPGLRALIESRVRDGSLARTFPWQDCSDTPDAITSTDEDLFRDSLLAHIPALAGTYPQKSDLPSTDVALDMVDFVASRIDEPTGRQYHSYFRHEHLTFHDDSWGLPRQQLKPGQAKFRDDVDLLFARNGIAFTLGDDMRVRRLGPPEAVALISDFKPNSENPQLNAKLNDAMTRFLSRHRADRQDALEKLWDAFEQVKYLGGPSVDIKQSVTSLLGRAAPEPFRKELDAEFKALTHIGHNYTIRHHGGQQKELPGDAAVDYLFIRLASVIAFVLRNTGRMTQ
ncbi:hypothetical protein [Actinomadura coerulea]|uniref:hypothetical protein n=1 Tax=Actinomadura coerulea TaxID=46159 RepID=UPI00342B9584